MAVNGEEKPIQVLVVEDDLRIAEVNRRFVERVDGFQVVGIAASGQEAKDQLELLLPDLVLLDVYFPDINGLELLSYMKEHPYRTDVIMLTAAREVDTVAEAIRLGVFDFIAKPLVFERLRQTLQNYREFRNKLQRLKREKPRIHQEEIDQLMRAAGSKAANEGKFTKGIDKITLAKISDYLKEKGEATSEQVGQETGTSRSTARRYLEYLVGRGEATTDLSYGVVGRPERVYRSLP
ncbi:response regulator [Brevibacillus fulvus]|uniref:Transcriptional regulatory protein n=1 Tax=Brevibacillus fulvus TaxID=1125967 RepID=A0A938Y3S5_9BACL|nr:response regulator [Brevibacillus fulvus]MBM7591426.1 two-component system CitB family response regulator [Brevibacillus fulvus]